MTRVTGSSEPPEPAALPAADDLEFLEAFEQLALPAREWTHLAHIRIAWTCFALMPPAAALERIRTGILRYNTRVLDRRDHYHDTVTVAFARLIRDRMRPGDDWPAYRRRIGDLLDAENPVLARYYSDERLRSDAARRGFVPPDRLPLPGID